MHKKRVILLQGNTVEAKMGARELEKAGYRVERRMAGPQVLRDIREAPPAAIVIDLARAPSQGRDIGIHIRHRKATRAIPIVFVDGAQEKVAKIKEHLPDAVFAQWDGIEEALMRAIAQPPVKPSVPRSLFSGYSGTPLVKKLGIKEKMVVVIINAPLNFEKILVGLPEGATIRKRLEKNNDLILWFVRSQKDMKDRIERMVTATGKGGLWIAWPKKNSAISSNLSQQIVRVIGLDAGLVDYKVCAIDNAWTGLKFACRK